MNVVSENRLKTIRTTVSETVVMDYSVEENLINNDLSITVNIFKAGIKIGFISLRRGGVGVSRINRYEDLTREEWILLSTKLHEDISTLLTSSEPELKD